MPLTKDNPTADTPTSPPPRRWRRLAAAAGIGALTLTALVAAPAQATHPEVSLTGSNFEIEDPDEGAGANLKLDDAAPSIDWATVTEVRKPDLLSGSGDDSFGQGSKEDTQVPAVVDGSIPPNKSDLLTFGTYLEDGDTKDFLHLYWHRVQEPSGTTNMDFEFNQVDEELGVDGISANGVTPIRVAGDLLIQYDLANGGTNPELFLSRWITQAEPRSGICEAANSLPCWEERVSLSDLGVATGSINTAAIPSGEADGLGAISARTFGEASVDFSALVDTEGECVSFGAAYLKSRSSDSFTAAMKDFIAPVNPELSSCAQVIIHKETDPASTQSFAFTSTFDSEEFGENPSFNLADDGTKTYDDVFFGDDLTVTEGPIPTGWDLATIDCSASTEDVEYLTDVLTATVTFDLEEPTDVLECTYTNRARGTIVVEKVTSDGSGAFDFTSGTLPDTEFTLTTTAAGTAGKDSETFSDLSPGTYDVAETVPANWNLSSATCDDASDPASIDLAAGETVTCTFTNAREVGALKIIKDRKHAADNDADPATTGETHPHVGVDFVVTGGSIPAGGTTVTTVLSDNGTPEDETDDYAYACVTGLVVSAFFPDAEDAYTVTETVPTGYVQSPPGAQTATVIESGADCDDAENPISAGATVSFTNTPKTDITVSVNSQVDGGTFSSIDCDNTVLSPDVDYNGDGDGNGDDSLTMADLPPGTYVCTIVVDP